MTVLGDGRLPAPQLRSHSPRENAAGRGFTATSEHQVRHRGNPPPASDQEGTAE